MYFTFDHPEYAWFLLSIPLLVVTHYAFLKYTRKRAIKFANFQALKRVTDEKIATKNYTILTLRLLVVACLVLSVMGTTFWYKGTSSNIDFVLAVDTSSSMTAKDLTPNRLEAAKDYLRTFVDNIRSDANVGIVSFSGAAFIELLPTADKTKIKNSITNMEFADVGGTDIPGAMVTGSNLLLSTKKGKVMILLTDGSNTVSFFTKDPITEGIRYAQQNNVIVYTIGLGTDSGPLGYLPEYYNVSSVYDESTLERIANETGGKYYYAADNIALEGTYQDILDNSKQAYISQDMTIPFLLIGLILIYVEWGLISTRFRSFP